MGKNKHNKKKNTAFLYEVLIREFAKAVFNKDQEKKAKLASLLKEHFGPGSLLRRELRLYQELSQSVCDDEQTAKAILTEVKTQHGLIDKQKLSTEQTKLGSKVRKALGNKAWNNFVPNFRTLASISQIFADNMAPKSKVLLESEIVGQMSTPKEDKQKLEPLDHIVMKQFVKRFNERYGSLHEEQSKLLQKFTLAFTDRGADLLLYLNEEVSRLRKEMKFVVNSPEVKKDPSMLEMAKKTETILEGFRKQKPDEKMVEKVLQIQGLIREVK